MNLFFKKSLTSLLLILSLLFSFFSCQEVKDEGEVPENKEGHIDENDDGICDDCSCSVIVFFDFYAINDLHGKITDSTTQPGIEELTSYLKAKKEENSNTVFLSSGDMWQGSSASNLTEGLIVTDWMNEMDFSSMTIGNHEFDWGEEPIEANSEFAEFPLLGINIYDRNTNKQVDYCQSSTITVVNGVKIGIIGAIGDCYSSIASDKTEDVYFKVGNDLTALVKNESKKLKAQGADIIVYSLHDGYGKSNNSTESISNGKLASYYDIELSAGGYVDVVFEGHSHQSYVLRDAAGVYHLQGGGDNNGISHAKLAINFARNESDVVNATAVKNSAYRNYKSDELVENLLTKYEDKIAMADIVLGTNSRTRYSDEIKQKIADLYCELGIELWGDEYDIFLGGGYISTRSPYNLAAGEVKYSDLQMLLPFDNTIVLCSISGSDLKRRFTETTNNDYYISYSDYGESFVDSINSNKTYYIVTDSYCSSYSANKLTVIKTHKDGVYARDLLAEYIESGAYN